MQVSAYLKDYAWNFASLVFERYFSTIVGFKRQPVKQARRRSRFAASPLRIADLVRQLDIYAEVAFLALIGTKARPENESFEFSTLLGLIIS